MMSGRRRRSDGSQAGKGKKIWHLTIVFGFLFGVIGLHQNTASIGGLEGGGAAREIVLETL